MQKSTLTIRLPDDLIEQLRQHAGLTGGYGRISEVAEHAIRVALDRESVTIPGAELDDLRKRSIPQSVVDAARSFGDQLDALQAERPFSPAKMMPTDEEWEADIAKVRGELGSFAHDAWRTMRALDDCRVAIADSADV